MPSDHSLTHHSPLTLSLSFRRSRERLRVPRKCGRLCHPPITQSPKHFQNFAPCRERPAIVALILIHGLHEGDFLFVVIALAGGRIHLTTPFAATFLGFAAVEGDRDAPLAAFPRVPAAIRDHVFRG